mmetsp:Transcript_42668/g.97876  ORF Transcript_42668/g.97876 Transcript_42668/m.97876 type:complete len:94 (+) Transcript_42668:142-423(+)
MGRHHVRKGGTRETLFGCFARRSRDTVEQSQRYSEKDSRSCSILELQPTWDRSPSLSSSRREHTSIEEYYEVRLDAKEGVLPFIRYLLVRTKR